MNRPTIVDIRRANHILESAAAGITTTNTTTTTTTTAISQSPQSSPSSSSLPFSVPSVPNLGLCTMFLLCMLGVFLFLQYCNWVILILLFVFFYPPSIFDISDISLISFVATNWTNVNCIRSDLFSRDLVVIFVCPVLTDSNENCGYMYLFWNT